MQKTMSAEIHDKEMAMSVLKELPPSSENLIVAIDALQNEDRLFTFHFAKSSRLFEEEEQRCETCRHKSVSSYDSSACVWNSSCDTVSPIWTGTWDWGETGLKYKAANVAGMDTLLAVVAETMSTGAVLCFLQAPC